jgi:hypothetical protein
VTGLDLSQSRHWQKVSLDSQDLSKLLIISGSVLLIGMSISKTDQKNASLEKSQKILISLDNID